jgi:hypothetical protein
MEFPPQDWVSSFSWVSGKYARCQWQGADERANWLAMARKQNTSKSKRSGLDLYNFLQVHTSKVHTLKTSHQIPPPKSFVIC